MGSASVSTPFLRAPPFPDRDVRITGATDSLAAHDANVLDLLRDARVGGAFWESPLVSTQPHPVVVRPHETDDPASLARVPALAQNPSVTTTIIASDRQTTMRDWHALGAALQAAGDPWTMLDGASHLIAHGDDEWVAVAHLLCIPTTILTSGRFGNPGDTAEAIAKHLLQTLSSVQYIDPFTGWPCSLIETVTVLAEWRRIITTNRTIGAACGMAWWKRDEMRRFLWAPGRKLSIAGGYRRALATARAADKALAIWPSRVPPELFAQAADQGTPLVRIEDGFIRSVGLGSNLVPPSSIVVDRQGIYFDPSQPSDLEAILATTQFTPPLLARARALGDAIVAAGISKYASGEAGQVPPTSGARRIVLVPAQVEDDMSVLAGGAGFCSNLELLRRARALEKDAEIWFRPHPDVDAGHRKGAVSDAVVLQYADRIVREASMAQLLESVDAVHVLTSLAGFESLLRGREVVCHGTPFYAGWGLTSDLGQVPDRRQRRLTVDELVAGVLILYPRYLDPVSGLPCPPEVLVKRLAQRHAPNRLSWVAPLRKWQGRLMASCR